MMTVLAIALLILVGGLFVAMAVTPMVAETNRRTAPARPVERRATVRSRWDNVRHAA